LIYRRHLVSLSAGNPVGGSDLKRKKGRGLPLSGKLPAVSADELACFKFNYRDVLISLLGGRGFGFPIAQNKPKLFCSVAVSSGSFAAFTSDGCELYATIV
jgi:hypothetical protein